MKKILSLLLVLAMALSLVACGGEKAAASGDKVAMVTDYGDITDQSFNQTTWEACQKFGETTGTEVKYYKPTTNDTAGRVASVELAIAEGHNVIVMPGCIHQRSRGNRTRYRQCRLPCCLLHRRPSQFCRLRARP